MSFLAPWALVAGVLAAVGAVLLHLVARQRPAAYLLPTARFIPDRRSLVARLATRPRDLGLLALRVLLLVSAAAAFARPVLAPRRAPLARIVLLDRSAAVARPTEALARARALLADGAPMQLVIFGERAVLAPDAAMLLDSLARDSSRGAGIGSITAALVAARRAAGPLARQADSVELLIISPVAAAQLDAATDSVRARWPGRISLMRVAGAPDSAANWTLERAVGMEDPLAPALARVRVAASPTAVRLRRGPLDAGDSAYARGGGAVVQWDVADTAPPRATALLIGDDVVVATLAREPVLLPGRVVARWSDGAPAAVESALGGGCVRHVGIGVPLAGDLPLRPSFQRAVAALMSVCGGASSGFGRPADSAVVARLTGASSLASGAALSMDSRASPLVPWLLGLALACALAELAVRARGSKDLP